MQKVFCILLISALLFGCSGSTHITGSWKDPQAMMAARNYNSVFIAALTRNIEVRTKLENALAAQAAQRNIQALKSTEYFTPSFQENMPSKEELLKKIQGTGAQAILTVSVIDKTSETRYVPGSAGYAPVPAFGWYRGFYTYYSHWYPFMYSPGYYVTDKTYFLETNLYDASNENLIWSAQSETVNPGSIDNFVSEFPKKVVDRMIRDGILKR